MKKIILTVAIASLVLSCATGQKLRKISEGQMTADLSLIQEDQLPEISKLGLHNDTTAVETTSEDEVIIMNAIKDENGEMVATDVIQPAMVTARFKNVAERQGKVDIAFDITISDQMLDSKWQLRIMPIMKTSRETSSMDSIMITGADYRKAQMKGYEHYERFLHSIAADSSRFIDRDQLEHFIERNLPEIYRYRKDSTMVTSAQFQSHFGITEKEALDHYTNQFIIRKNKRKLEKKEKMFRRYVKAPIITDGLKLDTVLVDDRHRIVYRYLQTINTYPGLKKAEIRVAGAIYEEDQKLYDMPGSAPLTFYISSLSSFIDTSTHYLDEVIFRRAQVNTACYIDFESGKDQIDRRLSNNQEELERIEGNLREIVENTKYDLDSIVVEASCSPEGRYSYNKKLAERRANSISMHFDRKLAHLYDSLERESGILYDLEGNPIRQAPKEKVRILYRSQPENWEMLDRLVCQDTLITAPQKSVYLRLARLKDLDLREQKLQAQPFYRTMRQRLYPKVRTVHFAFFLHRKNMVKDTVHTTRIDTVYQKGVEALRNREYDKAIGYLRPYKDFNAALAYCAMDYNNSALEILERMYASTRKATANPVPDRQPDPILTNKIRYMLAILYSRIGQERKAADYYMETCESDPSYISRGNLDPEISALIKKYGLNKI